MALDAVLLDVLKRHCSALGDTFTAQGGSKVLCRPSNRVVFAKTGRADQVLGEAESLDAMYRASQAAGHKETLIPTIHAFGKTQDGSRGFLVTDYKDLQSSLGKQAQRTLGRKLAEMHRHGTSDNGMYGFSRPTHCGETEQDNTWTASWPEFWADRRIGDLVRRSGDAELAKLEVQLREKVYPLIFNDEAMRSVRPSIIHGDLWSGNSGTDHDTGEPIIFDPSSSYSHNEAELGIMRMFGGYSSDFFDSYHEVMPKAQPYYAERIEMYEAYHHLNHFVIFGGSYKSGTVRIFKKLIAWAEKE
ncbi:Ketosamine-3-kinase, partial [Acaromyces ingoldii]